MSQDYYEVLGVDRNADARTIKKRTAKSRLANHPDQNQTTPKPRRAFAPRAKPIQCSAMTRSAACTTNTGRQG